MTDCHAYLQTGISSRHIRSTGNTNEAQMFFSSRTSRFFFLSACGFAVLALVWAGRLAWVRNAFAPPRPPRALQQEWTLRSTGGFDSLEGLFSAEGGQLDVYSYGEEPVRLSPNTGMPKYSSADDWPPAPKRKPFYHEVYDLVNGEWVRKLKGFSGAPDKYLDFGSCDRANHLDVAIEENMRVELPSAIKVKAIHKFPGYAAVVYSEPSQDPLDVLHHYPPIEVDLLVPDEGGWRVAHSQEADEYGYFCGTTAFSTSLANGETAEVLLVFSVDPGNGDDYYAARSFVVMKKPPQPSGK